MYINCLWMYMSGRLCVCVCILSRVDTSLHVVKEEGEDDEIGEGREFRLLVIDH